jgi:hypothetical protein
MQQPTGVQDRLNDVFFINYFTGWVVGGDFGTERILKQPTGRIGLKFKAAIRTKCFLFTLLMKIRVDSRRTKRS